eukprot:2596808-Lingulodinium_polyedra.AAC.1
MQIGATPRWPGRLAVSSWVPRLREHSSSSALRPALRPRLGPRDSALACARPSAASARAPAQHCAFVARVVALG